MAEMTGPRLYSCSNCRNHVAYHDDIISKAFQGRHGRAFLFSHAMNIIVGPKEDRHLMTGLHTVADVSCCDCRQVLGWKYERAYEESQKYKEGKFILEKSKIVNENCMAGVRNLVVYTDCLFLRGELHDYILRYGAEMDTKKVLSASIGLRTSKASKPNQDNFISSIFLFSGDVTMISREKLLKQMN